MKPSIKSLRRIVNNLNAFYGRDFTIEPGLDDVSVRLVEHSSSASSNILTTQIVDCFKKFPISFEVVDDCLTIAVDLK